MIAFRYLPGLAVLLAIASLPTVLHSYVGLTVADGRSTAAIPMRLNGLDARPSDRSLVWLPEAMGTTDFIERRYGRDLRLLVVRSYDAKRLYHHPELAVAHDDYYERTEIGRFAGRPEVPIFTLRGRDNRVALYTLLYDREFVDRPVSFQLRNAIALLVQPRQMMTLFFVRGSPGLKEYTPGKSPAEQLLLAAVDNFLAQRPAP
jgi:hypothetical protein